MRKTLTALACLLGIFTANTAAQDVKIGHFDSQEVLKVMPEVAEIDKTLNDEATKIESQLTILQEDFQKQYEDYQKNASTMTDAQRSAKEQELQELSNRIQTFVQTARQDIQKKQNELMQPILQKILAAVKQVGADEQFLYIFERKSGLILFDGPTGIDVTPSVKKRLGIAN